VDYLHTLSRDGGRCRQKDELDQVSRQCLREFPIADSESKEKLKEIIDGRLMTKVVHSVIRLKCEKLNVKLMKHSDIEVQDNPEELKILNSVQSNSPQNHNTRQPANCLDSRDERQSFCINSHPRSPAESGDGAFSLASITAIWTFLERSKADPGSRTVCIRGNLWQSKS
jgi:hypothetical protein